MDPQNTNYRKLADGLLDVYRQAKRMAHKTGRTSKTANGAKRRSILSSVLQSIGNHLGRFTLSAVIAEVQRWLEVGESSFASEVQ